MRQFRVLVKERDPSGFESVNAGGKRRKPLDEALLMSKWGLSAGCTLLANGAKWYFVRLGVGDVGGRPNVLAYKYFKNGRTSSKMTLLNVWRVE